MLVLLGAGRKRRPERDASESASQRRSARGPTRLAGWLAAAAHKPADELPFPRRSFSPARVTGEREREGGSGGQRSEVRATVSFGWLSQPWTCMGTKQTDESLSDWRGKRWCVGEGSTALFALALGARDGEKKEKGDTGRGDAAALAGLTMGRDTESMSLIILDPNLNKSYSPVWLNTDAWCRAPYARRLGYPTSPWNMGRGCGSMLGGSGPGIRLPCGGWRRLTGDNFPVLTLLRKLVQI